jgi:hypothetical protein
MKSHGEATSKITKPSAYYHTRTKSTESLHRGAANVEFVDLRTFRASSVELVIVGTVGASGVDFDIFAHLARQAPNSCLLLHLYGSRKLMIKKSGGGSKFNV